MPAIDGGVDADRSEFRSQEENANRKNPRASFEIIAKPASSNNSSVHRSPPVLFRKNTCKDNMWDRHASTSVRMEQYYNQGQIASMPRRRPRSRAKPDSQSPVLGHSLPVHSIVNTLRLGGEGQQEIDPDNCKMQDKKGRRRKKQ